MCSQLVTKSLLQLKQLTRAELPVLYQVVPTRHKSIIHTRGYKEIPEFKKKDLRYQTSAKHKPKLMSWQDYQCRKWKADHWNKRYPAWQARMDYAENLVRLGMPSWTIEKIVDIHPHCVQYLQRKVSGNIELLREAEYSNFVNHQPGCY